MNKTVIGIIIAVLLVGVGGWYFYSSRNSAANKPQLMQSMKELIASGVSQKCDFSEPQSNTSGTIYIAGGKVRGDFTSTSPSGVVGGHMISDGTSVHTWMEGMTQGFTSSFDMSGAPGGGDTQQGLDPSKKTDYKCEKWSADESKFQLPSGITFVDMSTIMKGPGTGATPAVGAPPTKTAQCSACDMAPEPQRTQCREALQCR